MPEPGPAAEGETEDGPGPTSWPIEWGDGPGYHTEKSPFYILIEPRDVHPPQAQTEHALLPVTEALTVSRLFQAPGENYLPGLQLFSKTHALATWKVAVPDFQPETDEVEEESTKSRAERVDVLPPQCKYIPLAGVHMLFVLKPLVVSTLSSSSTRATSAVPDSESICRNRHSIMLGCAHHMSCRSCVLGWAIQLQSRGMQRCRWKQTTKSRIPRQMKNSCQTMKRMKPMACSSPGRLQAQGPELPASSAERRFLLLCPSRYPQNARQHRQETPDPSLVYPCQPRTPQRALPRPQPDHSLTQQTYRYVAFLAAQLGLRACIIVMNCKVPSCCWMLRLLSTIRPSKTLAAGPRNNQEQQATSESSR